jgi:hypothetical protein
MTYFVTSHTEIRMELKDRGSDEHSKLVRDYGACEPYRLTLSRSHLQDVTITGDHLVKHRVDEEAEEEP